MHKPSQLLVAERAHAVRFQIGDVDKAEVHAALIERVPAGALGVLAMAFEIGLAIVLVDNIVLAEDIMDIELGFADDPFRIVELPGLRKMGDVAGVDHEGGLDRKSVHLIDRFLQGSERIGIGRFAKTYISAVREETSRRAYLFPVSCEFFTAKRPADVVARIRNRAEFPILERYCNLAIPCLGAPERRPGALPGSRCRPSFHLRP
jgi:hypothetical protein